MNPTLSWERVGAAFYRTFEGYSLEWAVRLPESHVRIARAGGLIAAWDRTDVIRQGAAPRPQVSIFSGLGTLLVSIPLDITSILDAGFTHDETFVVVMRSGQVRRYYDLAGNFSLVKVEAPLKAEFGSVVVVETMDQFVVVGKSVRFLDKPQPAESLGWTLGSDIIYWTSQGVFVLDFDGSQKLGRVKATSIVCSPDGTLFAITLGDGTTEVHRNDFSQHLATLKFSSKPVWVGSDALIELVPLADELEAIVHDLGGASSSLFLEQHTILHSEVDGVRIITEEKAHNLFCKVPSVAVDIFRLGSSAPSSVLLNCIDMLEQNSPRANENLGLISDLPRAIRDCCIAATYEMDPRVQKKLLKAANFGKSSLDLHDSTGYLEALDTIRVGNTVRDPKVGLFCTVAEIRQLVGTRSREKGAHVLVSLLEKRKIWDTALGLAKLLRVPIESVPIAWACDQIQGSTLDDETLRRNLDERLLKYTGLSYVAIGRKAYDEGRLELALGLIAREPNARSRIELLMDMGEYSMALDQSVKSEHLDLVYYVLYVLRKKLSLPQFYRAFRDNELAIQCYQTILKGQGSDPTKLHEFNYQMDRRDDDFQLLLAETFADPEPMLVSSLQKQTRGYFSKALGEYSQLLALQTQLQSEHETTFQNLTVTETISKLMVIGQVQRAQKLKSSFGVSDEQFWSLRINVFVERRDWDGLWQFAQQKSPIGYEAFYAACKNAGNFEAASRYIDLSSTSLQDKAQKYIELGFREQALELAKNDAGLLAQISSQ